MVETDAQIICGGQVEHPNKCVDFAADINFAFCERKLDDYNLLMHHMRTSRENYVVVDAGKTTFIHSG